MSRREHTVLRAQATGRSFKDTCLVGPCVHFHTPRGSSAAPPLPHPVSQPSASSPVKWVWGKDLYSGHKISANTQHVCG